MDVKPLDGKVVIITGGGRGMGRAMALAFARAGAAGIVVTSAASPNEIEAVAGECDALAGRAVGLAVSADVADAGACAEAVAATVARFGALHVLVNNAGKGMRHAADPRGPFWEVWSDGFERIVATNVNGPFHMAKPAAPHMIAAGWGRIINVTKSIESMYAARNTPYGATKAALDALTLSWAADLAGTGVTANLLAPGGLVNTTFSRPSAIPKARESGKRFFEADDIVPAALWLASDASAAYNGCRFNAGLWDAALAPDEAARAALEAPIFPRPRRASAHTAPWDAGASSM